MAPKEECQIIERLAPLSLVFHHMGGGVAQLTHSRLPSPPRGVYDEFDLFYHFPSVF